MRLIGVRTRGVPMAGRLAQAVREAAGIEVPLGSLDINLYRDDLTTVAAQPVVRFFHGAGLPDRRHRGDPGR